nr:hypothetical protein [uncultured Helicobacter sp.]
MWLFFTFYSFNSTFLKTQIKILISASRALLGLGVITSLSNIASATTLNENITINNDSDIHQYFTKDNQDIINYKKAAPQVVMEASI